MADTSIGLKENVAGVLCYMLGWLSGLAFLIIEHNNKKIKFHAYHSIIVFGALTIAFIIFRWIPHYVGTFFGAVIVGAGFVLWLFLMVTASQDKKNKLPWAGDMAEKWAGQPSRHEILPDNHH